METCKMCETEVSEINEMGICKDCDNQITESDKEPTLEDIHELSALPNKDGYDYDNPEED